MWPDTLTTTEFLQRAADGDAEAVERLLDRHRDSLRRLVALRLDKALARRVDASDVVQETLIEAHRRLDDYLRDPRLPFHLWLRQIAKDRMIDAHRRHRGAARRSLDREQPLAASIDERTPLDLAALVRDRQLTPAAAATQRELARRFDEAIAQLDDADREVIEMRHVEQLTNEETAQALGLSQPAAGMRYLRALRRLRAVLGDDLAPET